MRERSGRDRRKLRRYLAALDCAFETATGGGRGLIVNISQQGVFVRGEPLPEVSVPITLSIDPGGAGVSVAGTVRWTTAQLPHGSTPQRGFGVLVGPTDEFLALYEHILLN